MREIITPVFVTTDGKNWGLLVVIGSTQAGKENITIGLSAQVIPDGGQ